MVSTMVMMMVLMMKMMLVMNWWYWLGCALQQASNRQVCKRCWKDIRQVWGLTTHHYLRNHLQIPLCWLCRLSTGMLSQRCHNRIVGRDKSWCHVVVRALQIFSKVFSRQIMEVEKNKFSQYLDRPYIYEKESLSLMAKWLGIKFSVKFCQAPRCYPSFSQLWKDSQLSNCSQGSI